MKFFSLAIRGCVGQYYGVRQNLQFPGTCHVFRAAAQGMARMVYIGRTGERVFNR